jgi:hypothetical protein
VGYDKLAEQRTGLLGLFDAAFRKRQSSFTNQLDAVLRDEPAGVEVIYRASVKDFMNKAWNFNGLWLLSDAKKDVSSNGKPPSLLDLGGWFRE